MMQLEQKESPAANQQQSGMGVAVRFLVWIIAAGVAAIALIWLSRLGLIAISFFTLNDQVSEVRGLPGGVAKTLSLVLSILVVSLGAAALFYLVTGFRLIEALLALVALAALQFMIHTVVDHLAQPRQISLDSLSSRPLFDRKGNSLVWYAVTRKESCPEIFDAPGYHPVTREVLLPINAEIAQTIRSCLAAQSRVMQQNEALASRKEKGLIPVMISEPIGSVAFFDPTTGSPLVWAARNGDCYDLFRNGEGGFHPVTRSPLVAVDERLAVKIHDCKEREKDRLIRAEAARKTEALAAAEAAKRDAMRAEGSRLASEHAAQQPAPVSFTLVNEDCKVHDLYLNHSFQGRVTPNGGMIEFQVIPGSYSGKVCAPHDPNLCSPSKSEELVPGSRVVRKIRRNSRCFAGV